MYQVLESIHPLPEKIARFVPGGFVGLRGFGLEVLVTVMDC